MANKRFYWIKLKTDFFNQETIDFLMGQKNGCQYIVLYQMLCLMTANNEGKLCNNIGELIVPYDVDKITRDTKYFDFDTVTVALGLFKRIGLIYEEDDGVLKISNIDTMVGSESKWAEKKRLQREKKKKQINITGSNREIKGLKGDIVPKMSKKSEDIVRQEIDIEKDIELDIDIDKEKDIYINNINNNKNKNKQEKEKQVKEKEKEKEKSGASRTSGAKRTCMGDYDLIINANITDDDIKDALHEFIEMRKAIKKPLTIRALELLIKKLQSMSTNSETQLDILNQSIMNCWQSIYPLKADDKCDYRAKNSSNKPNNVDGDELPDWFASL